MSPQKTTVIVTQRERFTEFLGPLDSIYDNAGDEFELIYVDANSPYAVQKSLEKEAVARGFRLIRLNQLVGQNVARNIALQYAQGEYIVLADNDAFLGKDCIKRLTQCADETGAAIVGCLYMQGGPDTTTVHMSGGLNHLRRTENGNHLVQTHDHVGKNLSVVNTQVLSQRQQTEFIEFHCVLIRKSLFEKVGLLDEQYCAINDHEDLCLLASQAGESIWIEPAAVVRYDYSRPQQWCDLPFFSLRWSENWTKISVDHFCRKWDIANDDPWRKLPVNWVRFHRNRTPLPIACGAFVSRVIKAAFALQAAWTAVKKKPLVAQSVFPSSETATRKSRMVVASRS